jgi:5-methylthioadenosine/S-adenosylhomocysteine deaminase
MPSIAPHAPYTCTPEILLACAKLAIEFDIPLQIHLAETALEVENMRKDQGMPVIPYVRKYNIFDAKVLAAHCVHVDEGEIRTMQHSGAGIAHNPSSNLKLASGFAPVKRMLELGVNLGIGTDGPASNNDLDMFEEVRLAAFLAKASSDDPTAMPARQALACATRIGAKAMHIGDITGSLEVSKRADLIIVDISPLHNVPHFRRDPQSIYAQVVYASKATDVQHVIIDGQWVMRDHKLLTLNEPDLAVSAQEYAQKIDLFLIQREQSVISKLIAIGGATEEESFEIQVKVPVSDPTPILAAIKSSSINILRERHYHEYDTYFNFDNAEQGYLRYREDEFIGPKGEITNVRSRLTHIGPARENSFEGQVLLSRSRYLAPATHSLRFYREYFKPTSEQEIEKDRRRYLVAYKNTEFFINVDDVKKPRLGYFLEIKSRTWSRKDAQEKAQLAMELLNLLSVSGSTAAPSAQDYIEMAEGQ